MAGGVREIPLNRGMVTLVDEADFEWLSQWKWGAYRQSNGSHYVGRGDYPRGTVMMHKLLLPVEPPMVVDHKNGDPLDNRRANLRPATRRQNGVNAGLSRANTSGFKGVYLAASGKWIAAHRTGRRCRYLGSFVDPAEAARAYDAAVFALHGEFAFLNFPEAALATLHFKPSCCQASPCHIGAHIGGVLVSGAG